MYAYDIILRRAGGGVNGVLRIQSGFRFWFGRIGFGGRRGSRATAKPGLRVASRPAPAAAHPPKSPPRFRTSARRLCPGGCRGPWPRLRRASEGERVQPEPSRGRRRRDGGRGAQPRAQAAPRRVSGGAVAGAGAAPSGATRREGAEAMARGRSAGIAYPDTKRSEVSVAARSAAPIGGFRRSRQRGAKKGRALTGNAAHGGKDGRAIGA